MSPARSALLAFTMALVSVASARAGTYVYTLVGPPTPLYQEFAAQLSAINEAGAVVGSLGGAGMIWRGGVATPLGAPPGESFAAAVSITRYGIVLARDTGVDGTPGTYTYNTVTGGYRQVSVPGLTHLVGVSISGNGNIAGSGTLPSGPGSHAFAVVGRVAAILDPPGAVTSSAAQVMNDGTVFGSVTTAQGSFGFFHRDGAYTVLDPPGALGSSVAVVAPDGTAVGRFTTAVATGAYVYRSGAYTVVNPPGATSSRVTSISSDGTVVGSFATASETDGFTYKDGVYTIVAEPDAQSFPGYSDTTVATFAGPHGTIVGYYVALIPNHMFVYRNGHFATDLNAYDVYPTRILSDGRIFGWAEYSNNPVPFVGTASGLRYLILPRSFENDTLSVNGHGEFVGVAQVWGGNNQLFIATCPADQAPCDTVPAS